MGKNSAEWYSKGMISFDDYMNSIKYMKDNGYFEK